MATPKFSIKVIYQWQRQDSLPMPMATPKPNGNAKASFAQVQTLLTQDQAMKTLQQAQAEIQHQFNTYAFTETPIQVQQPERGAFNICIVFLAFCYIFLYPISRGFFFKIFMKNR